MIVGSLLLHALLLALILWLPPHKVLSGSSGPSFEMIMDGSPGTPNERSQETAAAPPGSNTPVDDPKQTTPAPPPAPVPDPARPPAPPPPAPVAPAPPAPEPPAPVAPPAPPVPDVPPAPPAPVTPPTPPPDAPPAPTPPPPNALPRVTLQDPDQVPDLVPPPLTRPPMDMTPLPPLTFAPPPPPPRPRQIARPQTQAPQRSASGFPTPQNWSLSGGLVSRPSQRGAGGDSALMAGPSLLGPSIPGPRITGADLGRDWIGEYTAWVRAHMYYPEQAAANNEDGTVEVIVQINRSGKVLSVELVTRSGSQWLDLATTGLFRGARVPRFPDNVTSDTATVDQTIHYIMKRR
jgi:protein TonB